MTRTEWACGISFVFIAAMTPPAARGRDEVTPGQAEASRARQVAALRLPAGAADTVRPAALSEDGRLIAFAARDPEKSPQGCCQHVYVLERSTGLTTRESVGPDGTPADGDSQAPSLSSDGRVIAFETVASNLLPGRPHVPQRHIIVRNRQSGAMRSPEGMQGERLNGESGEAVVSGSGLVVAFTSDADNLLPAPDANGRRTDVYLWRLDDSTMTRISVDTNGVQPRTGASHSPSVSRDGERVAFVSTARLAPEDTDDVADVYLRDVVHGITSLVSRGLGGKAADGPSHAPALSADGRRVAFVSRAGNLASRDRNGETDVYVHDLAAGTMTLVSATAKGVAANATSRRPAVSADSRYVVYQSLASNLGTGPGCPPAASDTNLLPDVYLFDRIAHCVTRISGSPAREWWTPSVAPAIDGAGSLVVFSSTQPIGVNDLSTDFDLFLFLRPDRETSLSR